MINLKLHIGETSSDLPKRIRHMEWPVSFQRITLQRTVCYGSCPAYTVSIDNAAHLTWEGKAFVALEGHHEEDLDPNVLLELDKALKKSGFRDMEFEEEPMPTDVSECRVTVKFADGTRKTITIWGGEGVPKKLFWFQNKIDEELGVAEKIGLARNTVDH